MASRPMGKGVAVSRRSAVQTDLVANEDRIANEDRYRAQMMQELAHLSAQVDELLARLEVLEEAQP